MDNPPPQLTDSAAAPGLIGELLRLYVPLLWLSIAQFPLVAGLEGMVALPVLASWGVLLVFGKLPPLWRWSGWGMLAAALAALALPAYSWWRLQVGCPHCFAQEWYYLGLANREAAPWILWGLVSLSIAMGLLLPGPRLPWCNSRQHKGRELLPWVLLGLVLVWPMLLAAGLLWSLLPMGSCGG